MLGITRLTRVRAGIRSSTLCKQSKIRDAAADAKLSRIRWVGHVTRFNDNRWTRAVSDWTSRDVKRTKVRPDGQTSSRSPSRIDTMLSVSFERTESTGQLWLARETNGRIAGARSVYPKINGSQGDQGDTKFFSGRKVQELRWSPFNEFALLAAAL
ncbi:hypothetical protein ANCDUO_07141 [Ancylostoma duodenale]|uniref:Uncharacterized protein n=1 Tax=Ancylostoma duodenale TaxID=51022 RepID=A0A0C2GMQ9_9BILA|nr:hypothetical protein ANCDUO_07141 [Ancylostoma duodenale]